MKEKIGTIIAIIIMIIAIAASIYLGIGVMFIGGIMQIVAAVQVAPIAGAALAFGIAKVVFFGIGLGIPFIIGLFISDFVIELTDD